jgi:hypothetical protein
LCTFPSSNPISPSNNPSPGGRCVVCTCSLPTFGGRLSARQAELLLSYLTVPYLRIPLVRPSTVVAVGTLLKP